MSQKQLKRYEIVKAFIEKRISRGEAAELLGMSERQVSRLKKGVLKSGVEALIHKNTGRPPAHALSHEKKEEILVIHAQTEHAGINFLHFKDILTESYGITISYSALYSLLQNKGIHSPKKKKIRHRTHRRMRKAHAGQLIQVDATPYEWFGGTSKMALYGGIDDATGQIVGLYLTKNECLYGYQQVLRQCVLNFGVPQTIYSDNHTIFRSPKTGKLTVDELIQGKRVNMTQFGRSLHELGIDLIYAKTPQAKGRIERLWDTLQSRLPVELRRRGIKTVEEANQFLEEYRSAFNQKFAVEAEQDSLFVPLREDVEVDEILCVKHKRKTDNAGSFSFSGRAFQILDNGFPIVSARKEIDVLIHPCYGIRVQYQGRTYDAIRYVKPQQKSKREPKKAGKSTSQNVLPHLKHSSEQWKEIWHYEDYDLSLQFLFELFFRKQQSSS